MKILYFELNGCRTENVAMATKFFTYLNIQPICAHAFDVIIFADSAVFFSRLAANFKPPYLGLKKILTNMSDSGLDLELAVIRAIAELSNIFQAKVIMIAKQLVWKKWYEFCSGCLLFLATRSTKQPTSDWLKFLITVARSLIMITNTEMTN